MPPIWSNTRSWLRIASSITRAWLVRRISRPAPIAASVHAWDTRRSSGRSCARWPMERDSPRTSSGAGPLQRLAQLIYTNPVAACPGRRLETGVSAEGPAVLPGNRRLLEYIGVCRGGGLRGGCAGGGTEAKTPWNGNHVDLSARRRLTPRLIGGPRSTRGWRRIPPDSRIPDYPSESVPVHFQASDTTPRCSAPRLEQYVI